jgi:hypothetical protein
MPDTLLLNLFIDCEATQPAINDPALGERGARGFADVLESFGMHGTFHVLPSELESAPHLYREIRDRGHEIGLHVHPVIEGYTEFLGVHSAEEQREIIGDASQRFSQVMGFRPPTFCPGYISTNDSTYQVLYELGFRHGCTSLPGRALPECASVHMGAPLDPHYAHPHNRLLVGDLDYVELPITVDPESRMWGGRHAQDLRVELVDAKNHWYTIKKAVTRQMAESAPLIYLRGFTHNTYDYTDQANFQRQTLEGMIERTKRLADELRLELVGTTSGQIAVVYRSAVH